MINVHSFSILIWYTPTLQQSTFYLVHVYQSLLVPYLQQSYHRYSLSTHLFPYVLHGFTIVKGFYPCIWEVCICFTSSFSTLTSSFSTLSVNLIPANLHSLWIISAYILYLSQLRKTKISYPNITDKHSIIQASYLLLNFFHSPKFSVHPVLFLIIQL